MKNVESIISLKKFTYLILALILVACGNSQHVEELEIEKKEDTVKENITTLIWVNSYQSDCNALRAEQPFLLTHEGQERPSESWDCFYSEIIGFEYERGHIYQLKVEKKMQDGKPQLKYIETISKERDPKYYMLHDIWALTHLKGDVLEISATRPNMEINLTTMKIMGKGMCNQYFGKIESHTTSSIGFGPIAGTKMMCPEIATEDAFLAALAETETYRIQGLKLSFYNNEEEEILRFQKID